MPKIIEKVREQLIAEARRQSSEVGYAQMTMRSVASACGIATGTIYNYFPSKDMLVAAFMLEDWKVCADSLKKRIARTDSAEKMLKTVFTELSDFEKSHEKLFSDTDAIHTYANSFGESHVSFRLRVSELIRPAFSASAEKDNPFLPEFIVEALIAWTLEEAEFEEFFSVVRHLI